MAGAERRAQGVTGGRVGHSGHLGRYLLVGTALGLFTVALREALGWALSALPGSYALSMVLAYGLAMLLGYVLQGRISFARSGHLACAPGLAAFAVVVLVVALFTAQFAYVLRYGLGLQTWWGAGAAPLAFALAALAAAPLSFGLARQLVYLRQAPAREAGEPWPLWVLVVGCTALHAWTLSRVSWRLNASAIYDEGLFLRLAQSLVQGDWLGPYSSTTLVKGPGFSLWLAAVHVVQMPLSLAVSLSYALACVLMLLALRPLLPSACARGAIFVALLGCPMAASDFAVMRELIYPSLCLAVVACGLGLMLRVDTNWQRVPPWCWALGLGLMTGALVLTREESLWLAPLCLAVLGRVLWRSWSTRRESLAHHVPVAAVALAAVFALLPSLMVASLNRHHYGVFTVLEFNSRPFVSAYGALLRIRHAGGPPQVPVPREVWQAAAGVSPAFAAVNLHLQGAIGNKARGPGIAMLGPLLDVDPAIRRWFGDKLQRPLPADERDASAWLREAYRSDAVFRARIERFLGGAESTRAFYSGAMDGDIGGAWFVWTFREAVAATGAHRSATQAAAFYQRMADEINAACARGALACRSERHSLTPILQRRHWVPFLATLWPAAWHLMASPMHSSGGLMVAMGKPEALAVAQDFVHQPLAASRAEVPAAQPVEAVITVYQWLVPPASALAAMAWVLATPWPRRVVTPAQAGLWCLGALLLVLVMSRLVLLALIHVSSWPAALEVRYLAPAQPLWLCWVGIGWVLLGWQLKSKVSRSLP